MPDTDKPAEIENRKTCELCYREKVSEEYCNYHDMAYQNVQNSYADWQQAYEDLSFEEYLQKLIENAATGVWVREVAQRLLEQKKGKKNSSK